MHSILLTFTKSLSFSYSHRYVTLKEVPNRVIASYAFPGVFSTPDMARQHAATLRQMLVNDQLMTLNEGKE